MSKKIAVAAICIGLIAGYSAIHLEHMAMQEACEQGWEHDIGNALAAPQRENHDLPFKTTQEMQQQYPEHVTACVKTDPTQDFVNGFATALVFGSLAYFTMLLFRKASKALS